MAISHWQMNRKVEHIFDASSGTVQPTTSNEIVASMFLITVHL